MAQSYRVIRDRGAGRREINMQRRGMSEARVCAYGKTGKSVGVRMMCEVALSISAVMRVL